MPDPNSGDTERVVPSSQGEILHPAEGSVPRPGTGEFATVERLRRLLADAGPVAPSGEVWIGDDTAVLEPPRGRMLLTTDLVVAGVHGDLELITVADLGYRAMVASLSDIAAMGGRPCHAVIAVAGPADTDLDDLYRGVSDASVEFGCPVVGGDLSNAEELCVAVSMTGEVEGTPGPVLRAGARPGDLLFVTGTLGASAAGLRLLRTRRRAPETPEDRYLIDAHRRPRPRLAQGEAARLGRARAMVDVSDGLAGDLRRLAEASGVGIHLEDVPVAQGATEDEALYGGEDYELVMATPDAKVLTDVFVSRGLDPPHLLGRCVEDPAERSWRGQVLAGGWEHAFSVDHLG